MARWNAVTMEVVAAEASQQLREALKAAVVAHFRRQRQSVCWTDDRSPAGGSPERRARAPAITLLLYQTEDRIQVPQLLARLQSYLRVPGARPYSTRVGCCAAVIGSVGSMSRRCALAAAPATAAAFTGAAFTGAALQAGDEWDGVSVCRLSPCPHLCAPLPPRHARPARCARDDRRLELQDPGAQVGPPGPLRHVFLGRRL